MIHNEEKTQSIKTDLELTQVLELADKDKQLLKVYFICSKS